MIEWINNNKEWFLSGLGVFLLTIVSGIVKYLFSKKNNNRTINLSSTYKCNFLGADNKQ